MSSPSKPESPEVEKLNRKHHELGEIKLKHIRCRRKTGVYGALGGALLAFSTLGSFQYVTSQKTDWSKNPDSPVYSIAQQAEDGFQVPLVALLAGFVGGLALFYKARKNFMRQEHLWISENLLILEIRQLRDKLYPRNPAQEVRHPAKPREHASPLPADEARGEYLGVYSPHSDQTSRKPH